jgi:replicative DNA helicase
MEKNNSKFRRKLVEIMESEHFSDVFLHEKVTELLNEYSFLAVKDLKEPSTLNELLNSSISYLRAENKEFDYKSNIVDLDNATGGFGLGEFVIIGARPGVGKTKFLQYLMLQGARDFPVLYFALDSGKDSFVNGLISSLTEINYTNFRKKIISEEQWKLIHRVKSDIENLPIYVCDEVINSMQAFRILCDRYIDELGVKAIYVDFLQLLGSNRYRYQRDLELGYVSRELKNLAREKNVCVIASSQLSRSCESRGGEKRPVLSDLRESGSFEQDADKILLLYRAEYYGFEIDEMGNSTKNILDIEVAKNRNGFTDRIRVKHNLPYGGLMPFIPYEPNIQFDRDRLREIEEDESPF